MPEVIETVVYRLDELDGAARERARAWFRRIEFDDDWHEPVYDDFARVCAILGVDLRTVPLRLFGGGTRAKPCIFFSGFWSQGDGACFEGRYAYARGGAAAIRAHAPRDADLHAIADALGAVQRRHYYQLRADIRHHGRYYHEHSMAIAVERDSPTRRCDWRIADLVADAAPTTLYLVVPPSDIARTKPLIRLVLNQIGRRLTEDLHAKERKHRVLMMLDEFPALGRLDFFESALAFMAGYGLKAFLIAQSLNQIEKAYGNNNSILDNCHVRVSFAANDERTAKRVSDALGTATEMKAQKNYAGHRLSPWLGHLMVSRSETARPLLTPGEVMQLPPADEIVMVAGTPPIRAKKARYYEDARFKERVLPPPDPAKSACSKRTDGWSTLAPIQPDAALLAAARAAEADKANAGLRREPELPEHVAIAPEIPKAPGDEFAVMMDDEEDDAARQTRAMRQQMRGLARQVSLDPADGMEL